MAFWVWYDHAGKLILASTLWALVGVLPLLAAWPALLGDDAAGRFAVGLPLVALALTVTWPVATVGMAHMVKELIDTRDGSFAAVFAGIRLYAGRAVLLGVLYTAATVCLATSVWFYGVRVGERVPWLGFPLSGLALWCLLLVLLSMPLGYVALVQKKTGVREALRLAGLLVLGNPLLAAGLAVQLAAATLFALAVAPLFVFLYGGWIVVLASTTYEMLARKYASVASGAASPAPTARRLPMDDDDDDYLNRGFRDFLFPWKG